MKRHKRNVGARARHDEHARAVRDGGDDERPPERGSSGGAERETGEEAPDRFGATPSGRSRPR
jgi:hypothetical protein